MYAISQGLPTLTTSWIEGATIRFGHRRAFARSAIATAAAVLASAVGGSVIAAITIQDATTGVVAATGLLSATVSAYLVALASHQANLRFGRLTSVTILRTIAGTGLAVLGGALTNDPAWSILGLAVGFAVGPAAFRTMSRSRDVADTAGDPAPDRSQIRTYAAGSLAFALGLYVLGVGDRFILSANGLQSELGLYAATYAIVDLIIRFGPAVVLLPLRARTIRAWDDGHPSAARGTVIAVTVLVCWALGVLSLALVAVLPRIPGLPVEPRFAGPIVAGTSAFVVASALGVLFNAARRQARLAVNTWSAAIANVILNVALVPAFGALGSAAATAIAYGALLLLNIVSLGVARDVLADRRLLSLSVAGLVGISSVATWGAGPPPLLLVLVPAGLLLVTFPATTRVARTALAARQVLARG
jgi:O-antigen/teichoic acid export membrane protein